MSVVVSIEDLGACRKRLQIEVPAPAVDAETQRVIQQFRRRARIPGFRKGKVPLQVVRQRFGDDIDREVVELLVPRYWKQAREESQIDALLPPEVSDVDLGPETGLRFAATVEVRPDIRIGEIGDFDLPEADTEPAAEEIDRALEDLRRGVAEWVAADRPAARGDLVTGQIVELGADGEPAGDPRPASFEVGQPTVWEELSLAVTGAAPGREVDFERREGPEEPARKMRVAVESVKTRDLPPLDDDFAAKVGEYESLEELRGDVVERLRRAKTDEARHKREQAMLDQLRARHPTELPAGVVKRETESLLREYAENLARQGVDLEGANIDWQALGEQIQPRAERQVHARLLLDALVDELDVEVTEAEFEASLAALARAQGRSTPALRQAMDRAGSLGELRAQLARRQVMMRLLGEEPDGPPDAADESGEKTEKGNE